MAYIKLIDLRTAREVEFRQDEVRVGRARASDLVLEGEGSEVASSRHLRLVHQDNRWAIEDLDSRNGSYVDNVRLAPRTVQPLRVGAVIRCGERGPRLRVEAVAAEDLERTVLEAPPVQRLIRPSDATAKMDAFDASKGPVAAPPPAPPRAPSPPPAAAPPPVPHVPPPATAEPAAPAAPAVYIEMIEALSGQPFKVEGGRIRVGRGRECEVQVIGAGDTSVSRLHAEIRLKPDGRVVVKDAQSRNGTLLNGSAITGEREIKGGDRIQLGEGGPELLVSKMRVQGRDEPDVAPLDERDGKAVPSGAGAGRTPRRSFGGKGATMFFNDMFRESEQKAAKRVRSVVWISVGVLIIAVGVLYVVSEMRVRQTTAELQRQQQETIAQAQAIADSVQQSANAEYARLRSELEQAQGSAAPAVIESLRLAVSEAQQRTSRLELALRSAQASLDQQLAAGDSIRRARQEELNQLRGELQSGSSTGLAGPALDSIRAAIRAAEDRASAAEAQVRAVRGANLAAVSQANQGAIGLVTAFMPEGIFDGSGFVITPSGYFVTNRHVVSSQGRPPDSVFVTMADEQRMRRADIEVVGTAGGPDIAVLKIRGYTGAHVPKVDWSGQRVRQGEPAAIIGFPAGLSMALDRSRTVRTFMSAGIFSKVTEDGINFDGFTTGGSSGSPVFNADGEVVGVHRAGLKEAVGMGFAVRIDQLVALLPAAAKRELGLP